MSGAETDLAAPARPTSSLPPRIEFLGMEFDTLTIGELMHWAATRDSQEPFAYVVTPNVDHVVSRDRAPERLAPAYRDAAVSVCDSRVLSRLARLAGLKLRPVPGSDFTALFLSTIVRPDDAIVILGSEPDQIEQLKARYGLKRITHHNPPMGLASKPEAMEEAARFVVLHPARYVFLALGSPQQELLAHRIWRDGEARGLGFCIGASIDFLTGKARRAPKLMQQMGLEWLHRLSQEPGRVWRRYLVDDMAILALYWRWRTRRSK
jgi:N-acetylglucosaminyldiphosphoundecaprenol N-acetyl-beta-D-mannosaminyltransferase